MITGYGHGCEDFIKVFGSYHNKPHEVRTKSGHQGEFGRLTTQHSQEYPQCQRQRIQEWHGAILVAAIGHGLFELFCIDFDGVISAKELCSVHLDP